MKQTIEIPQLPPMMNELIRMNRWDYGKQRDNWAWLIRAESPAKHQGKVNIRLTRVSTQTPDPDNVAASFKLIGDALESIGVIEDDSFNTIRNFDVRWAKADKQDEQKVIIEIEDIVDLRFQYQRMLHLLKRNNYVECEYAKRMGVNSPRGQVGVLRKKGYTIVSYAPKTYKLIKNGKEQV